MNEAAVWCDVALARARSPASLCTFEYRNLHDVYDRTAAVENVVTARAAALTAIAQPVKKENRPPGRVRAVCPDLYLFEQLEQNECEGFLDDGVLAPVDTWLLYTDVVLEHARGVLLSWVPMTFVDGVQCAINVNTTNCIVWYEDLPAAMACEPNRSLGRTWLRQQFGWSGDPVP